MIDLTQQETIPSDLLQEHSQSLETLSTTSELLLINIPDIDISTVQPMNIEQPQPMQYPTTFQQMSSQQRATITNTALINFFGNASTVSTIMQTVQQTQHQQQTEQHNLGININDTHLISTEQCQQLSHNPQVVVTDSEEEPGMFNSLNITQQNNTQTEQQISHIQPPISISTSISTTSISASTVTNSTLTTTQLDYTRQSYRVPSYYANSLSYINSRRRRQNTHTNSKQRKKTQKER